MSSDEISCAELSCGEVTVVKRLRKCSRDEVSHPLRFIAATKSSYCCSSLPFTVQQLHKLNHGSSSMDGSCSAILCLGMTIFWIFSWCELNFPCWLCFMRNRVHSIWYSQCGFLLHVVEALGNTTTLSIPSSSTLDYLTNTTIHSTANTTLAPNTTTHTTANTTPAPNTTTHTTANTTPAPNTTTHTTANTTLAPNTTTHITANTTPAPNTTTHTTANTTLAPNTTTHTTANTTLAPNTTTHSTANTTLAPNTTTALHTTLPTPTLAPRPSPPSNGNYTVKNGTDACIMALMGVELELYNSTKIKGYFNIVPDKTQATGTCGDKKANLKLTFTNGFINFGFVQDKSGYYIKDVIVLFKFGSETWLANNTNEKLLYTDNGYSVKCKNTPTIKWNNYLSLVITDVKLQAFGIHNGIFGKEKECYADINQTLIPVGVVLSIVGLFLIIFVVILLARRRRNSDYQRI
ncbi:lysosome-associated membrane glycoprotein 3 [Pelodytes ibericus]